MSIFDTKEKTGATYTATLKDSNGTVIPLANITTITLTLYNLDDESIINSRNDQNVLNANNVTIHSTSGLLTWSMQADDNPIVDADQLAEQSSAHQTELHRALFEYVGDFTASPGKHTVDIRVSNLIKVS